MTWRWAAGLLWAASLTGLAIWWALTRRRVDIWRHLPTPTALLGPDGTVRAATGPAGGWDPTPLPALPAPGQVVRTATPDGTPLAVGGFRGGALAVALPRDPVTRAQVQILPPLQLKVQVRGRFPG